MNDQVRLEKIVALAKRRGFIYPSSEIYGGLANVYDYGPLGVELKNNIKNLWWQKFVHQRQDIVGLDSSILMNPKIWEASGHIANFTDPLIECKSCHSRFRADQVSADFNSLPCPNCDKQDGYFPAQQFNLMFKTKIGATQKEETDIYLRPETAQAIFANFKNVVETTRIKLPFGIAQIGKAFRNEITTGYFIFRMLEFEQMEIEYFIQEENWEKAFEQWQDKILNWAQSIGLQKANIRFRQHDDKERSHYSKKTVDLEYNFSGDYKEIYGLAYRGDYDLAAHQKHSGIDLSVDGKLPHVIEPSFGVDRTVLSILLDSYYQDEKRVVLKLKPKLAPYKVAVFPLVANKEELVMKARSVFELINKAEINCAWDDRGNIGKRYLSQDEIGTPFCLTIDYTTLEDDTITVRFRDDMQQERVNIGKILEFIENKID